MNKKAFATAVASVAVAGTIAAPAMADETAVTPVEQAQQAVAQAQDAATVQRAAEIRDAALRSNIALDYVTQLTTRFGARPPVRPPNSRPQPGPPTICAPRGSRTSASRNFR